jgi:heme-degrading monooxygenase HmoA
MARLGTDRIRLARVDGLVFWRLLGTGRGDDTGPSADFRRTALFAVWDDEDALERFLAASVVARRWRQAEEVWHVRLRGAGGHGTWRGVDPLAELAEGTTDGPLAIITRADVHRRSWRAFRAAGPAVSDELRSADGLLAVVGIGEAPVGRLGTFSLWRSLADVRHFAVGMPHHREVVRRTRAEDWYGEELFARFEPYASSGSWGGRDPLA